MFRIENQGSNVILIYELSETDIIDTFSCGMISNNNISGLNKFAVVHMDDKTYVHYNISGEIELSHFFAGNVNKARFITAIVSILNAIIISEQYMLEPTQIILDSERIYCNVNTGECDLIYLPVKMDNKVFDFSSFIKEIMFNTSFDQNENCDYVAKIIGYVKEHNNLALPDFKKYILQLANTDINTIKQSQRPTPMESQMQAVVPVAATRSDLVEEVRNVPNVPNVPSIANVPNIPNIPVNTPNQMISSLPPLPVDKKSKPKKLSWFKRRKEKVRESNNGFAIPGQPNPANSNFSFNKTSNNVNNSSNMSSNNVRSTSNVDNSNSNNISFGMIANSGISQTPNMVQGNFGETTVLGGNTMGETTVLSSVNNYVEARPYLIRAKNGEKILIDADIFKIGKEKSYVNYFIADNSAISRAHAEIIKSDTQYYILDNRSTNCTYVDGLMISPEVKVKLKSGTKIKLANEEFEFILE